MIQVVIHEYYREKQCSKFQMVRIHGPHTDLSVISFVQQLQCPVIIYIKFGGDLTDNTPLQPSRSSTCRHSTVTCESELLALVFDPCYLCLAWLFFVKSGVFILSSVVMPSSKPSKSALCINKNTDGCYIFFALWSVTSQKNVT